jgi:hypothetical protein
MDRSRKQGDISDMIGNRTRGTQGREIGSLYGRENEMQGIDRG